METENEKFVTGSVTTLYTRIPGRIFPRWLRFRARGRLTPQDRRRLSLEQADLVDRILTVKGVMGVRVTGASIVVQACAIDPVDEFQVRLHMVSFTYESHAGEVWQKLKEFGAPVRLAA